MATIRDICEHLENLAPLSTQESYDNSGLLTGNKNSLVKGIICSLDCTEEVIQEAINKGCNLVVCHHPIIFKGLKSLTGKNYVERTIIKAIQNDIAIYAIHTNLDNYLKGVNYKIAELLGIKHPKILSPLSNQLLKLKTYVPLEHIEKVASALFHAGAGNIGNYDECSFSTTGIGTFRANNNATPFVGEKDVRHHEEEKSLEVIVPKALKGKITTALLHAHP